MKHILTSLIVTLLLASCANPGTRLTGGDKDETPPEVVEAIPANYSTHFDATEVVIEFNEYLNPQNKIKQKLVVSPVMDPAPVAKVRGKFLEITLEAELLPDKTYAFNFGDAVTDLNESNPLDNFMYVFSTGDKLDSLEIAGTVIHSETNEPAENVAVMLYQEDEDSLPMKQLPIYLSLTDETGQFNLKNLAAGSYKIFALSDANSNFLFDQPKEQIAFLDTLITPRIDTLTPPTTKKDTCHPRLARNDTIPIQDTCHPGLDPGPGLIGTDTIPKKDTCHPGLDPGPGPGLAENDTTLFDDTIPKKDLKFQYTPNNLLLKTFTEVYQKQYISGTSRPMKNKIEVIFNQDLDSLSYQINPDTATLTHRLSLKTNPQDTLTFWLTDSSLFNSDTLRYAFYYTAFDSLEQPIPASDTIAFSFRQVPPKPGDNNPFQVTTNFNRTLELGVTPTLTFTEPWQQIDTTKIELYQTKDTLQTPIKLIITNQAPCHPGLDPGLLGTNTIPKKDTCHPGLDPGPGPGLLGTDTIAAQDTCHPGRDPGPGLLGTSTTITTPLLPDSTYALYLYPGAFTTYTGLTNDSLKVAFRVGKPDQYGSVLLTIEGLDEPVIIQLIKGKDKIIDERRIDTSGQLHFEFLKTGKYKFKMIFDENQNGKWDTGRYLKKIQPERILLFGKELDVKANWELEETWNLSDG